MLLAASFQQVFVGIGDMNVVMKNMTRITEGISYYEGSCRLEPEAWRGSLIKTLNMPSNLLLDQSGMYWHPEFLFCCDRGS